MGRCFGFVCSGGGLGAADAMGAGQWGFTVGGITTHSTGARDSVAFMQDLRVIAAPRARLIRALDACGR